MAVRTVALYSTTITSAVTTLTITGLAGNTQLMYQLSCKFVNGYNGEVGIGLRFNADTGNNYGVQNVRGTDTTTSATRDGDISSIQFVGYCRATGHVSMSDTFIYAKSGYPRTCLLYMNDAISTTTVTSIWFVGGSWSNTSDEITSIAVFSSATTGIGSGSTITLYTQTTV